jgi:hypothetical protein
LKERDVRNGVFAGFDDMVATYSSDTFYKEAIMIMATIVWRNSRERLKLAQYLGVMIDEATDCMIKAKLLTFYRYASPLGKLV